MARPFAIPRLLSALLLLTPAAFAQSLVESDDVDAIRQAFDTAASATQLRCKVHPVQPELTYAFRFQIGYTVDVPLNQYRGSGHGFTTYLRVTPEGKDPTYLNKMEALPVVPETRAEAELAGNFAAGEGAYRVELLLQDDQHRVCRGAWPIQAKLSTAEHQLNVPTPTGAVQELSAGAWSPPTNPAGPRIGRLTILLHAASPVSTRAKLLPEEVDRLVDSLSSLMRQLPANSVRLIAFNLDQRTVLFRKDGFAGDHMGDLVSAMNQMDLAKVDYRILQRPDRPIDLLLQLLLADLQDAAPPDAVLVLGSRTSVPLRDDPEGDSAKRSSAKPPIFYLRFESGKAVSIAQVRSSGNLPSAQTGRGADPSMGLPIPPPMAPVTVDPVERLMKGMRGDTTALRTPHDLATAILRLDAKIPKTAAPPPPPSETSERTATPDTEPQEGEDPIAILARVRDQVLQTGQRIPNYACVETVRRDRFEPVDGRAHQSCSAVFARRKQPNSQSRLTLDSTDWLRLDVALASDREMFSWAGARKFEEGEIDDLVPEGGIGTGAFAALLLNAFSPGGPPFSFEGATAIDLRRVFEYSYVVPQDRSTYRVKADKQWVISGYQGRVFIDPKTADLVRLEIQTDELPPETHSCENDTSLDFGVVQLGRAGYLLPKLARQRFIGRQGAESENAMTFSACREYQAESKLSFGAGASTSRSSSGSPASTFQLPDGLPVTIELLTPIHASGAAAGDRLEGRLAKPIVDRHQKTLAPEGTLVEGRLMRVETRYDLRSALTVALRWESLRLNGDAIIPLALIPVRRVSAPQPAGALRRRGIPIDLPLPSESKYGVFRFSGTNAVVESGFQSDWLTGNN